MPQSGVDADSPQIDLTGHDGHSPGAPKVYLSPPTVGEREIELVTAALRSGWVAPVGPDLAEFERGICEFTRIPFAVALSSGTAAIHLGLKALGVGPGDEVVVPTLTFGATAFAVVHAGGVPAFLDSEETTWNLDPQLLADFLAERARTGSLPKAIITVDLFGRMCDYAAIEALADRYEIPILEDAAEALGSWQGSRSAGSFGRVGVFSFNGNKIMTTSGGGMLVTEDPAIAYKVRYWSTQSREDCSWYEHHEIGFNYRMSNILAALGRAQLERLPQTLQHREHTYAEYRRRLEPFPVTVHGHDPLGRPNLWLTPIVFQGHLDLARDRSTLVRERLQTFGIEARPIWKPMHQQPVFRSMNTHLTGVADDAFARGICLPSGPQVSPSVLHTITEVLLGATT